MQKPLKSRKRIELWWVEHRGLQPRSTMIKREDSRTKLESKRMRTRADEDMNILARPPSGEGPLSSPGFTDEDPLGSAETITTREYYLGYLQGSPF
eukprot:4198317-Amphidinium_carterae.1